MTDRKQALIELLGKVEAGEWGHRRSTFKLAGFGDGMCVDMVRAYNGSLDAAMAMHEAVLPNRYWNMAEFDGAWTVQIPVSTFKRYEATSEHNPSRAWLIAIIKALISQR